MTHSDAHTESLFVVCPCSCSCCDRGKRCLHDKVSREQLWKCQQLNMLLSCRTAQPIFCCTDGALLAWHRRVDPLYLYVMKEQLRIIIIILIPTIVITVVIFRFGCSCKTYISIYIIYRYLFSLLPYTNRVIGWIVSLCQITWRSGYELCVMFNSTLFQRPTTVTDFGQIGLHLWRKCSLVLPLVLPGCSFLTLCAIIAARYF